MNPSTRASTVTRILAVTRVLTVARIMTVSTLIAAAALATGYGLNRQPLGSLIFSALGLLWLAGQRYTLRIFPELGLFGFTAGALLGALYGVQNAWTLAGITAALIAWDLQHFVAHIRAGERDETPPAEAAAEDTDPAGALEAATAERLDAHRRALTRVHLQRLAIVSGAGLLLSVLALTIRLTLSFGVIVVLGLVAIYALSRLIRYLRRESD
jgi:hypothetical protein